MANISIAHQIASLKINVLTAKFARSGIVIPKVAPKVIPNVAPKVIPNVAPVIATKVVPLTNYQVLQSQVVQLQSQLNNHPVRLQLEQKIEELQAKILELKQSENNTLCCICMEKPKNYLLLKCNHLCMCGGCSIKVKACPICRTEYNVDTDVVKIYP